MYRLWYMLDFETRLAKEQTPEIPVRFYRTEAGSSIGCVASIRPAGTLSGLTS